MEVLRLVVSTAGSPENRALLLDPHSGISVALIQGGTISTGDASELASLGTLFYEPLWWFRRREIQVEGVAGLVGKNLSIGPEGSGTRALSLELVKAAGLDGQRIVGSAPASSRRLLAGEIDVVWMMAACDAPMKLRLRRIFHSLRPQRLPIRPPRDEVGDTF